MKITKELKNTKETIETVFGNEKKRGRRRACPMIKIYDHHQNRLI